MPDIFLFTSVKSSFVKDALCALPAQTNRIVVINIDQREGTMFFPDVTQLGTKEIIIPDPYSFQSLAAMQENQIVDFCDNIIRLLIFKGIIRISGALNNIFLIDASSALPMAGVIKKHQAGRVLFTGLIQPLLENLHYAGNKYLGKHINFFDGIIYRTHEEATFLRKQYSKTESLMQIGFAPSPVLERWLHGPLKTNESPAFEYVLFAIEHLNNTQLKHLTNAIKLVHSQHPGTRFVLCGDLDYNKLYAQLGSASSTVIVERSDDQHVMLNWLYGAVTTVLLSPRPPEVFNLIDILVVSRSVVAGRRAVPTNVATDFQDECALQLMDGSYSAETLQDLLLVAIKDKASPRTPIDLNGIPGYDIAGNEQKFYSFIKSTYEAAVSN
ncbi:hypothetical protein [Chitinophaga sp. RAB17]|uniref:hypothetical protein n=1 Tax=Chitinophaga sp. RAB17 TaxID=3233049 RepID=UPI003F91334C